MPCWFDQDEDEPDDRVIAALEKGGYIERVVLSAQPCGCDPGCKPEPHYCERHEEIEQVRRVLNADLKIASERVLTLELENQRLRRRLESIDHSPECNSRFASTCGDSQRCNCGKGDDI